MSIMQVMTQSQSNLNSITDSIKLLAPEIATQLKSRFAKLADFGQAQEAQDVTLAADMFISNLIKKEVAEKHDLLFDSEEEPLFKDSKDRFVLRADPLDGTKHFRVGLDLFSCALSLSYSNVVKFAMVIHPTTGRIYSAYQGKGAFLNDRPIQTSTHKLEKGFVFYEQPHPDDLAYQHLETILRKTNLHSFRLRNIGNASLSLCYLAQGAAVAFVNLSRTTKLYDVEAGQFIALEAGAKLLKLNLKAPPMKLNQGKKVLSQCMIVANPQAYHQLDKIIQEAEL